MWLPNPIGAGEVAADIERCRDEGCPLASATVTLGGMAYSPVLGILFRTHVPEGQAHVRHLLLMFLAGDDLLYGSTQDVDDLLGSSLRQRKAPR